MPVIEKIKEALHIGGSSANSGSSEGPAEVIQTPKTAGRSPAFSPEEVTVIFVLGGPGVGKGTQCANLVKDYHFVHLSAGDLLRAEQARPGSETGAMIKEYIKEGKIVPMEVTIKLLETAMSSAIASPPPEWKETSTAPRFLIDGFPRQMDQALSFDSTVCPSKAVLFFSCSEEVMQERLLERAKTSGRDDDNMESILKRFRTFVETSMPVVDYYKSIDKVNEIPATGTKEEVYEQVQTELAKIIGQWKRVTA